MAIKNRVNLQTTINDNLPNNAEGTITPELHREVETDLNDSAYNKITDKGLVGLKLYDPTRSYESNEATVYNDGAGLRTWLSNKPTTGAFDSADWELTEGAVNEAPIDGVYYARRNGGWADIGDALGTVLALQIVQVKADLPTPIAGVITLEDNVRYEFAALIDLGTDRIVTAQDNGLITLGSNEFGIKGTATPLIEVPTGSTLTCSSITISGETTGQVGIQSNSSLSVFGNSISFINLDKGFVANGTNNLFIENCFFLANNSCISFEGTGINYANLDSNLFQQFVNYGVDYGNAVLSSAIVVGNLFTGNSGSFNISGLVSSGNISKRARYLLNNFNGAGTFLENITINDLKHEFLYNDGVGCNSADVGRIYLANEVLDTALTQNLYSTINATWTLDPSSARFTNVVDEVLQCISETCHVGEVTYTISANKDGNGEQNYSAMLYENGVQLAQSQCVARLGNKESGTMSASCLVVLDKTKNYDLRVTNLSNNDDILVRSASLTVRRLT